MRAKAAETARRDGNPGKRPLRDPVVPGGRRVPAAPRWLRPSMRRVFVDVRRDLEQAGVLAHLDGQSLTRYAVAQGLAAEIVESFGELSIDELVLAETVRGQARHPRVTTLLALLTEARLIGQTLGDNPSARASLGMNGLEGAGSNIEDEIGLPPRLRIVGGTD
jgi:phage terminase small subunit